MNIKVGNFTSEKNSFPKSITWALDLTGQLKNTSSIVNPTILVEATNPSTYNYMYIPEFNRYYFIDNCRSIRTGLWELDCKCDVLETYSTSIKANTGIVLRQKNIRSQYLTDSKISLNSTMRVRLKSFNYTFTKQNLVLTVAGGDH